jgi:hypothetical protein
VDLVRAEGNKMRLPVSQRFGFRRGGAAGECKQDGGQQAKRTILIMPKIPFLIMINRGMLRGRRRIGNNSIVRFSAV